ncbi:MAG: Rossmann-fold NAD(P)-binding domain-containing protein [Microthrixaceae bacterium]
MPLQKITAAESVPMTGFVITDLEGAERATGVVRLAKKVLQDGARTMARSQTYAWAVLGQRISGASAGISVEPAARAEALAAFIGAVAPRVEAGELSLDAAKGVGPDDLIALAEVDVRPAVRRSATPTGTLVDVLLAHGASTAAAATLGDLAGRRVAVEGAGAATGAVLAELAARGAVLVALATGTGAVVDADGLDVAALLAAWAEHGDGLPGALGSDVPAGVVLGADADVLLCGSKLGLIDHEVAAGLGAGLVVPIAPAPVTAKGLAVATRRGTTVLPDFVTTCGPLFADHPGDGATEASLREEVASTVTEVLGSVADHPEGPVLGACYRAEDFLRTWQERLPFGRPLA